MTCAGHVVENYFKELQFQGGGGGGLGVGGGGGVGGSGQGGVRQDTKGWN